MAVKNKVKTHKNCQMSHEIIQTKVQMEIFSNFLNFDDSTKFFSNLEMAKRFKINDIKRFDDI